MAVPVGAAQAANFNIPDGDVVALKNAIKAANTNGQSDIITLATGGTYALIATDNAEISPTDGVNGLPIIRVDGGNALTINGNGATLRRQSNANFRLVSVDYFAVANFNDVNFRGGIANNATTEPKVGGGALYNRGIVMLEACRFNDNQATRGGAIFNQGELIVRNSSFAGNTASEGGAIANRYGHGTVSFSGSSFAGNSANTGGALWIFQTSVTVGSSTFTGNSATGSGGAIALSESGASINIEDSTLDSNRAINQNGGALDISGSAAIISRCTISNNSASDGGGLSNSNSGGLFLSNSTVSGNTARGATNRTGGFRGGGLYIGGSQQNFSAPRTNLDSCTFFGNRAPNSAQSTVGGIFVSDATLNIKNSIVAGNNNGNARDIEVTGNGARLSSGGNNLIGPSPMALGFIASDRLNVIDPKLGPLQNNGGPTATHLPLPGSAAMGAGSTDLETDQRGVTRTQGAATDVGAVQSRLSSQRGPDYIVTNTRDDGDGFCDAANEGDGCTLRESLEAARADGAMSSTIRFAAGIGDTITLLETLVVNKQGSLNIEAPAAGLTLDGNSKSQVLNIVADANLTATRLTITGGDATATGTSDGGGIFNAGRMTLNNGTIRGNRAVVGGGIYSSGDFTLNNCSVTNNSALSSGSGLTGGGGIVAIGFSGSFINGSTIAANTTNGGSGGGVLLLSGPLTVRNSTISGNVAGVTESADNRGGGGGIAVSGNGPELTLDSSTIADNRAPNIDAGKRGGIVINGGKLSPTNSIVAGNGAGDIALLSFGSASTLSSGGSNFIGQGNGTAGFVSSDRVGTTQVPLDARIDVLRNNGGPTLTRAPLPGSPVIDNGQTTLATDQRGIQRPQGRASDIGAVEVENSSLTVTITPAAPTTNQTLVASLSGPQANGNSTSYQWKKNGAVIVGETNSTLNLSKAGNGDKNDVISVEVTAGNGGATASVQIINSAPQAISSQGTVEAEVEKAFVLTGTDADGDPLTFRRVGGPVNGTAEIKIDPADGQLKLFYRSRARYSGVEVIRFVALDNEGKTSNISTLGISVKYTAPPVNRAPIAGDTNIDTFVGKSEIKGLLGSDPDGDAITFRIVNNARYGTSEIRRDTDGFFKLFYTSLNRFYGPDRVTYIVTDSRGKESNVATVNINFHQPFAGRATQPVAGRIGRIGVAVLVRRRSR